MKLQVAILVNVDVERIDDAVGAAYRAITVDGGLFECATTEPCKDCGTFVCEDSKTHSSELRVPRMHQC